MGKQILSGGVDAWLYKSGVVSVWFYGQIKMEWWVGAIYKKVE